MELTDLKKAYEKLSKKYEIPGFKEVNENFEVDRIERNTDCLLREVRKTMMDKIIGYVRFIEMILNPAQAPPMFMMFVKDVTDKERKNIESVYKNFVELELRSLKLEVDYNEKSEAATIKNILEVWNKVKPDLISVIGVMEKNWNSDNQRKEKDYFG